MPNLITRRETSTTGKRKRGRERERGKDRTANFMPDRFRQEARELEEREGGRGRERETVETHSFQLQSSPLAKGGYTETKTPKYQNAQAVQTRLKYVYIPLSPISFPGTP